MKIFAFLTFFAFLAVVVHSLTPSELHDLRVQRVTETQVANTWDCETFTNWINNDNVTTEDITFCLSFIGCYEGRLSISEYYDLALIPEGDCGNFFDRQVVRLEGKSVVGSIKPTDEDPDIYTGYQIVNGHYGANISKPGGTDFAAVTRGHLSASRVQFVPGTGIIKKYATDTYGNELITVSQQYSGIADPNVLCYFVDVAQAIYEQRFGYYPSNVTGFDMRPENPNGYPDCVGYWSGIQAEGEDKCGTPLATHTLTCAQLHIFTFMSDKGEAVHATHWAKRGLPTHHKCIDYCLPVLETCHPNASKIPSNKVNFEEAKIDYTCRCPDGWKGDGVNSCEPVHCIHDFQCKKPRASYCDQELGLCMAKPSYTWDPVEGKAVCPEEHRNYYNWTKGEFECIADFKCWNDWHCEDQSKKTVTCSYPGNLASPLGVCICNPGYEGGYKVPCICPEPKKEKFLTFGERVCLAEDECMNDFHCRWGTSCVAINGETSIGHCQ